MSASVPEVDAGLVEVLVDALCPPPCRVGMVVSIVGKPTQFGPRTPCVKHAGQAAHLARAVQTHIDAAVAEGVGEALEGAAQMLDGLAAGARAYNDDDLASGIDESSRAIRAFAVASEQVPATGGGS